MRQKDPGSPVMATGASDASDIEILRERVIFNVGGKELLESMISTSAKAGGHATWSEDLKSIVYEICV